MSQKAGTILTAIFADMVADGWHERPHTTAEAADEAVRRLREAAEDGEAAADWSISNLLHDGARRGWNGYLQREKQTYWIGHDGQPLGGGQRVPLRQAIPNRRSDGTVDGSYQRPLIWALSWDEWQEKYDAYRRQAQGLAAEIVLYRQVLDLRQRYPSACTPLEACQLAGLDIAKLSFGAATEVPA